MQVIGGNGAESCGVSGDRGTDGGASVGTSLALLVPAGSLCLVCLFREPDRARPRPGAHPGAAW